jgi:succinate dehydrogenase/fumarate reductase flavoprotein subunit
VRVITGVGLVRPIQRHCSDSLSRDVPFSVLFFPGYADLKKLLANEKGENSIPSLLVAGGAAGAIAAAAVTPTDVIKTRYSTFRQ